MKPLAITRAFVISLSCSGGERGPTDIHDERACPSTGDPEDAARDALAADEVGRAPTVQMMNPYGESLFRCCAAVVGSALAPDVHQQIFVQAFRDLPRLRGDSSLRTRL